MMRLTLLTFFAAIAATPVLAANEVALDNAVFVERVAVDARGQSRVMLEKPSVVVPGDHLLFVLKYRNAGARPADDFVITNPLPAAVQFQEAEDANAMVSVDGGKQWGQLADLTVTQSDGTRRPALPSDVTHLRWAFQRPIPAGGVGKIMFRGVVK